MKVATLVLVLACVMSMPAVAQQGNEGNAGSIIRGLEHDWVEGQSRNDNKALNLIFDDALVYVEYGKLVTKGEYLSRVRTTSPSPAQIVMEGMTIHLFGDTATVVGTYREKSADDGKTVIKHWRFVDTWVNKKGHWMLVAAAAAPLTK